MKLKSLLCIAAVTSSLLIATRSTLAAEIHCPETITELPTVSNKNKEWTVITSSGERQLESIGIYLGTPAEYGAQVPDSTRTIGKKEDITWKITRSTADTFWLGCSYVGTTAMLFQKLAATVKECVATYDLLPSGKRQRLRTVECR